jgi:hypothetical protein
VSLLSLHHRICWKISLALMHSLGGRPRPRFTPLTVSAAAGAGAGAFAAFGFAAAGSSADSDAAAGNLAARVQQAFRVDGFQRDAKGLQDGLGCILRAKFGRMTSNQTPLLGDTVHYILRIQFHYSKESVIVLLPVSVCEGIPNISCVLWDDGALVPRRGSFSFISRRLARSWATTLARALGGGA